MAGLTNNRIGALALAVVIGGMAVAMVRPDAVEAPPAAPPEAAELIASAALAAAFQDNEIAAAAKFGGPLRISGTIEEITTSLGGAPLLLLDGGVNIALLRSEMAGAAQLHKGAKIEVACGKVRAALGTANGLDCMILPDTGASFAP